MLSRAAAAYHGVSLLMAHIVDRVLFAPIIGFASYYAHYWLYALVFIWFAPRVQGAAFWASCVAGSAMVSVVVGGMFALPLAYLYRSSAWLAGTFAGVTVAAMYAYERAPWGARPPLAQVVGIIEVVLIVIALPLAAVLAQRHVLPRIEAAFAVRRGAS
jgi:hypothetical protein